MIGETEMNIVVGDGTNHDRARDLGIEDVGGRRECIVQKVVFDCESDEYCHYLWNCKCRIVTSLYKITITATISPMICAVDLHRICRGEFTNDSVSFKS